jgi:FMN phosphatase YigB (HAD superfamily)
MLIFDFDGVLVDSIDEIAITAYNAATGRMVFSLDAVPEHVWKLFRKNRFHVQSIGDTLPLMRWFLKEGRFDPHRVLSPGEYQRILEQENAPLTDRVGLFFLTRKIFIEKNEEGWISLNAPFQPIWDELKRFSGEIVLLTNKNKEATVRLCRRFGLRLQEPDVYSGDRGRSKIENLNRIHRRFDRAPYDFVDDSLKNLRELDIHFNRDRFPQDHSGRPFLKPILAGWGYVGPEDEKGARALRYPVFTQQDLIELLHRRRI